MAEVSLTLTLRTSILLIRLCLLDDCLDNFLLLPPAFIVAPPMWSLVLALQA
jgi:hypothetical protein